MNKNFGSIDAAKAEWGALLPLSPENERRLWQKLRLEWNYHSNHIEGNTLTYGETELLLIHGQTHGNHSIREYEEMQAHDVGIAHLRELAADHSRFISESDIRNLNKIILKEPFWKPAQTPDGQATREQIIPGEYKTSPNNVITATGELFEFASPADVPIKMQALVTWLEDSLQNFNELNLLGLLAKLHHDFVLIHPFDDGNGRVARMLVNYVLMRLGYPPIIVPTERKKDYLTALRLADAGDLIELENFLGTCVIRSLELGIKAAKGESLEEPGDVEKEIKLFAQKQQQYKDRVRPKSREAIEELYHHGLRNLINTIVEKFSVFEPLFVETKCFASPASPTGDTDVFFCFEHEMEKGYTGHHQFSLAFLLRGYRGEASRPFSIQHQFMINFQEFEYSIIMQNQQLVRKRYTEFLSQVEILQISEAVLTSLFTDIKQNAGHKE